MDYYRIKTEYTEELDGGALGKRKVEDLVFATSYTEAEKVAYALIEHLSRTQFSDNIDIEIVKTKIGEVLYNNILVPEENLVCGLKHTYFEDEEDSGVGLYAVKVLLSTIDEKTAKQKKTTETIYVPAESNTHAAEMINAYLAVVEGRDFVVRDIKFDKAASITWPVDVYEKKCKQDSGI